MIFSLFMALFATKLLQNCYKIATFWCPNILTSVVYRRQWGRSSVGRALEWHSRGRQFDPDRLHKTTISPLF